MNQEIFVVGLNHSTAPVEVREKIVFPGDEQGDVTSRFQQSAHVDEAMILSTCNRSEVIVSTIEPESAPERVIHAIETIHGVNQEAFRPFLFVKSGIEAVSHVFKVSSSLDSMVIGEPQILGQVKDGFRRATYAKTTGPIINRLLHRSFFTAKRVRCETGVGLAAVSVAYVAVELAAKILGELNDKRVLLIGAGEMAELAARHLAGQVAEPISVTNRTFENACTLARDLCGNALPFEELNYALTEADVVITSTGSCDPIVSRPGMKQVMKARRFRPIFLIDIAIPRDVDPEVNELDGVYVYNIDDLQAVADENIGERRREAIKGEAIVAEEAAKFMDWLQTLEAAPTIVALKDKLEAIRQGEMDRMNGRLAHLRPEEREAVEAITKSIINKIAHNPIVFLKKAGSLQKKHMYLDVAQRLFDLNERASSAITEPQEPTE